MRTSPTAFLGSLASCHAEEAFAQYSGAAPLPQGSLLHDWVDDSLQRVRRAAPGGTYQSDLDPLLPATAGTFFSFISSADSSVATKLQHTLTAKANLHQLKATVKRMKEQAARGEQLEWAHHKATTATGAWGWKVVQPEDPRMRLSDVEYVIAARLNLGLRPFPAQTMAVLPVHCPLCTHRMTGEPVSLHDDPWHWLSCVSMNNGEGSRRHDAVVDAIGRVAWQVGAQVKREVDGLHSQHSKQRPDLQFVFPGRMLLSDVVVSHPLTASFISRSNSTAAVTQRTKDKKYAGVASHIGAELMNACVETCGGLGTGTVRLAQAIGEEGERWSMGTWVNGTIERQLLGAIAIAVQRGNAMVVLTGYTRATARVNRGYRAESGGEAEEQGGSEWAGRAD